MQLRYATTVTGEEYVSQKLWRVASLERCPLHPGGGCQFSRHGTYRRQSPPGTRIARFYCRRGHRTFSLLPDCLAARVTGTLAEVEATVTAVEQAKSVEAACATLRPEIDLPGVLRWVRWRVQAVHAALVTLKGLMPECFSGCQPSCMAFAAHLGLEALLPALREIAACYLCSLPPPLGFRPQPREGGEPVDAHQHSAGPDPPTPLA